jgi:hypothetical protein
MTQATASWPTGPRSTRQPAPGRRCQGRPSAGETATSRSGPARNSSSGRLLRRDITPGRRGRVPTLLSATAALRRRSPSSRRRWRTPSTHRRVPHRSNVDGCTVAPPQPGHRRGPIPVVLPAWTATSRPRCPAVHQASQERAAASDRVSTRTGSGVHSDKGRGLLLAALFVFHGWSRGRPCGTVHRPRAAVACGLQEGLVGAVAAAWVPPAAAGTGDLAAQPGPQRRASQRHRRAGNDLVRDRERGALG